MSRFIIEVCANSVASALAAEQGGATRVELCVGIPEGGTTPSYGEICMARQRLNIVLNVIIRPRGGDFLYSKDELAVMEEDIKMAKSLGVDGVVFGCLTANGDVDIDVCSRLIKVADGISMTFHRAFDMCREPLKAMEDIIALGFDRILTSGCAPTAYEGRELIKTLVDRASDRIVIMPGCGINAKNIVELSDYTKANEFHASLRQKQESAMIYRNSAPSMGGVVTIDEYTRELTSSILVSEILDL